MKRLIAELRIALRRGAALLSMRRLSSTAPVPRAPVLLILTFLWLAAYAGLSYMWAGDYRWFDEYGLNTLLAGWLVFLALIILFSSTVRRAPLGRALADVLAIGFLAMLATLVLAMGAHFADAETTFPQVAMAVWVAMLAIYFWQIAAIWRAGRSVFPANVRWPGVKLLAASLLPMLLIPDTPIVRGNTALESRIDVWSWPAAYRAYFTDENDTAAEDPTPAFDYEKVLYQQAALVDAALERVAPSSGDDAQFYFAGVAPSSYHSVFTREAQSAHDIFNERFGTEDRSVLLISDQETADTLPLANMTNLSRVLDGLGQKMNKDRDVLVLFITSHGSEKSLQVYFPGVRFNDMTSQRLASTLDSSGIKNRVIVVSACHSGSLIPDLEGPNTLILTAAHADKTSFGCSNDRDWTYFGDAFFNHALRETHSFTAAFDKAKALIAEWETEQGVTPSEPQISAGEGILAKLETMTHRSTGKRSADLDPPRPPSP